MLGSHAEIIAAFGGIRPLADAIGVRPEIAIHWHHRGIPSKYWISIEDAAATRGLLITARTLLATHPKQKKAA